MIVLVLTALLTIAPLVPLLAIPADVAIAVLTVLAWRRRQQAAASLGLFSVTCIGLAVAGVGPQQVLFPIAFATYFIVVWRVPWLRRASSWLKWGALDATVLAFALAFVYGIALGALRRMAGGLLAPWIAHVLTDIVIFSMVIALARA